ncbi:MAG: hypothetical protein AAGF93_24825 [Cyanobacteria bacterium P01_H01_bin.105]
MQCTTNSVSQVLSSKFEQIVSAYPVDPYQTALKNDAIKQLLLDYVAYKLKQAIPRLNEPQQWQGLPHDLERQIDLELRLESYIYWGIEYIIHHQVDLLLQPEAIAPSQGTMQEMTATCMPSHWFG